MAFLLQVDGERMCYHKLDNDNDPLIAPSSQADGQPVRFEWEAPYLTCFNAQFKASGKKHYFGIANGHGKPFAAWDADLSSKKYEWTGDGKTFTNVKHGYRVKILQEDPNNLNVKLVPLYRGAGNSSGQTTQTIKYSLGYSSMKDITSEVHAKVCTEASGKFAGLGANASTEIQSSLKAASNFTKSEAVEMTQEVKINMNKPCYIYSTECTFSFGGQSYKVSGGIVQSPAPLQG